MGNLKDLIVNGVARIIGNLYVGGNAKVNGDVTINASSGNPLTIDETDSYVKTTLGYTPPHVVELTQAQYDALATKDPNVTYAITDNDGLTDSVNETLNDLDTRVSSNTTAISQLSSDLGNLFKVGTVNIDYNIAANNVTHFSTKTVIDSITPNGYKYFAINGFRTNKEFVVPVHISYGSSSYSAMLLNSNNVNVSASLGIDCIFIKE